MKIDLINYLLFILIILILLKIIQNLYFEKKFMTKEKFDENEETYKLINLNLHDKGDSFSDNFNINPNLTGTHISTPLEIENQKID
jgi:hypothetical protein